MWVFLLKSTACLAIFMAFYKLLLENEPMHGFKRVYLIGALLLSLVIPSIVFVEYIEVAPPVVQVENLETPPQQMVVATADEPADLDGTYILAFVYLLGLSVLLFRFSKNLRRIVIDIRNNPKLRVHSLVKVLLPNGTVPHTFFNYIFLNKRKFESSEIPEEVLLHEAAHAKQKHSLDILFVELAQILFWFNPLVYVLKNWIKLNHEFLADQAVIKSGTPTHQYQNTLLAFASSTNPKDNQSSLANAINYSSIKKRFTVMKKSTSQKSVILRSFAALPLIAMLILGFSEQVTLPKEPAPLQITQNGATDGELERYDKLARKYNAQPVEKRLIPLKDLKVLETLYRKMSESQKENARPFPECHLQKTVQEIEIGVNKNGLLLIDAQLLEVDELPEYLKQLNTPKTYEEREKKLRVLITADAKAPQEVLEKIDAIVSEFGAAMVNIIEHKAYPQQASLTPKEFKEYNKLAGKYNAMIAKGKNLRIRQSDVERMQYLYEGMDAEQRKNAEPFPELPEPPAPPVPPTPPEEAIELEEDMDFTIAIDEKAVADIVEHQEIYDAVGSVPVHKIIVSTKNKDHVIELSPSTKAAIKKKILVMAPPLTAEEATEIAEDIEYSITIDEKAVEELIEAKEIYDEVQVVEHIDRPHGEAVVVRKSFTVKPVSPPQPKSPVEHVREMAQKNALFYYKGKKISSKKAIEILEKSKSVNIDSRSTKGKRPVVKLSTEPIEIDD
ncbi:M56 family metallopeptidase [Pseudozobellia thermophila]|uniref:Signal transducer regulating beta-lactamase production, contains metallopeptidase domain n=1 Tax=Pseudozobellia thermophila TaxID=192903 RepID=A0A1M6N061_9FLAO|nr:M56 family metallopeptidase [Pseudozobellia thermophila]SHJ89064.1 Signal transducer regulating beta-lactamase production, contains metallopeptidase domain [Pseudozobellia thermophila]